MALPTRGTKPNSTHQWAGTNPSHQEACTSPWTNLTHQGTDTRTKNCSLASGIGASLVAQMEEWR